MTMRGAVGGSSIIRPPICAVINSRGRHAVILRFAKLLPSRGFNALEVQKAFSFRAPFSSFAT
jgi:hypothetical protein